MCAATSECNQFNNNCLSCIQYTPNTVFQCSYCPKDGVCHTVGSIFNKCSSDECISLSSASSCDKNTADDCSAVKYGTPSFAEHLLAAVEQDEQRGHLKGSRI